MAHDETNPFHPVNFKKTKGLLWYLPPIDCVFTHKEARSDEFQGGPQDD
jgi:hypothetical protein